MTYAILLTWYGAGHTHTHSHHINYSTKLSLTSLNIFINITLLTIYMHQQVCLARSSRTARQEGRDTNQLLRMRDHVEITLVVYNKAQTQITHKATFV